MSLNIILRPIPRDRYISIKTDAISCSYNTTKFTPMSIAMGMCNINPEDISHYDESHYKPVFNLITHGDNLPILITTNNVIGLIDCHDAASQIIVEADGYLCESLCMTHFYFIPTKFPDDCFRQYMAGIEQARYYSKLRSIIVDVDEKHLSKAMKIHEKVKFSVIRNPYHIKTKIPDFEWHQCLVENGYVSSQYKLASLIMNDKTLSDGAVKAQMWTTIGLILESKKHRNAQPMINYQHITLSEDQAEEALNLAMIWLEDKLTLIPGRDTSGWSNELVNFVSNPHLY